jgi:hypothetical protein
MNLAIRDFARMMTAGNGVTPLWHRRQDRTCVQTLKDRVNNDLVAFFKA